jgi:methyl-accepting chemotaxis protein
MARWFALYIAILIGALAALAAWGCIGLTRHAIVAIDRVGEAGAGFNQTLAKVNGRHGTIAMLDEDIGAAKSMIIHADLVARHEQQQLSTWDDRGAQLFSNINGGVTDLRKTIQQTGDAADSFGDTADAGARLVEDLRREVNDTKHGLGPILENANGAVTDARSLTPDTQRIVKASAGTMEHVEGISGDIQKQTHKLNEPQTKMQRVINAAPVAVKVGWLVCVLSGHC